MLGREVSNVPNPDPKQYSFIDAFFFGMLVWWWAQTCPPPPPHPTVQTYINFRKFAKFYLRSIKTYHFQTFTIYKALFSSSVWLWIFRNWSKSKVEKSVERSILAQLFMISFNSHKLINKTLRPGNDILIFLWSWYIVFLFIIILRMCS